MKLQFTLNDDSSTKYEVDLQPLEDKMLQDAANSDVKLQSLRLSEDDELVATMSDGTELTLDMSLFNTNVYNADGMLDTDRVINQNGQKFKFEGGAWNEVTIKGNSGDGGYLRLESNDGASGFYQKRGSVALWSEVANKDVWMYSPDTNSLILGNGTGQKTNLFVRGTLRDKNGTEGTEGQTLVSTADGVEWRSRPKIVKTILGGGNKSVSSSNQWEDILTETITVRSGEMVSVSTLLSGKNADTGAGRILTRIVVNGTGMWSSGAVQEFGGKNTDAAHASLNSLTAWLSDVDGDIEVKLQSRSSKTFNISENDEWRGATMITTIA